MHPRIVPKAAAALALSLAFGRPALAAEAPESTHPLADMVRTELEFAATAARSGVRAAFLEYLAEDSITFGPAPVNARKGFETGPDSPGTLEWYPEYALVSSSGDLGLSTGPFVVKAPGRPEGHGHFTSIWRKQPDGRWRAVFDSGIAHAAPGAPPARLDPAKLEATKGNPAPAGATEASLHVMDQEFARSARTQGYSATLRKLAHPEVRIQRSGSLPIVGVRAAAAALRGMATHGEWHTDFAAVSGDFGYTYGRARAAGANGKERDTDAWIRVWQYADGGWRLVLDQVTEIPE